MLQELDTGSAHVVEPEHLQSAATPTQPFPFQNLPTEIQFQIWKLALPRGRTLRVALDFQKGKARPIAPFSRIPTILHICRGSRQFALSVLVRGFGEANSRDTFYWCPEFDRLFFLPSREWSALHEMNLSVQGEKTSPDQSESYTFFKHLVPEVQHLALPLNRWIANGFGYEPYGFDAWVARLLYKLPILKSLCLVVEPYENWMGEFAQTAHTAYDSYQPSVNFRPIPSTKVSTLVLYEPQENPIGFMHGKAPAVIEGDVRSQLDSFRERWRFSSWNAPSVRVLVLGHKKFKNSSFCLFSQRNLEFDQDGHAIGMSRHAWTRLTYWDTSRVVP